MPFGQPLFAIARRALGICALVFAGAGASFGQFANHSFEKLGVSWRALQRPDGNIWVLYEEPLDEHDITNRFDVPQLFKTAVLRNTGASIAGTDQVVFVGNRFTFGFFTLATQPDNKLLIGTEDGRFQRLNPDGSLDSSFNPAVTGEVDAVAVQPDGKIIVSPQLVRLNPDGSKDPSFASPLTGESPGPIALQSSGKILVDRQGPGPAKQRFDSVQRRGRDLCRHAAAARWQPRLQLRSTKSR